MRKLYHIRNGDTRIFHCAYTITQASISAVSRLLHHAGECPSWTLCSFSLDIGHPLSGISSLTRVPMRLALLSQPVGRLSEPSSPLTNAHCVAENCRNICGVWNVKQPTAHSLWISPSASMSWRMMMKQLSFPCRKRSPSTWPTVREKNLLRSYIWTNMTVQWSLSFLPKQEGANSSSPLRCNAILRYTHSCPFRGIVGV